MSLKKSIPHTVDTKWNTYAILFLYTSLVSYITNSKQYTQASYHLFIPLLRNTIPHTVDFRYTTYEIGYIYKALFRIILPYTSASKEDKYAYSCLFKCLLKTYLYLTQSISNGLHRQSIVYIKLYSGTVCPIIVIKRIDRHRLIYTIIYLGTLLFIKLSLNGINW